VGARMRRWVGETRGGMSGLKTHRVPLPVTRSDELTRFIYALKEIRACLEAELLTDVQQRMASLTRDMDNQNGQRIPHQPALSRG